MLEGQDSLTIDGIELVVPYVGFTVPADVFTGLRGVNQDLMKGYSIGLKVAIGIYAADAAGLTVTDCTFSFAAAGQANVFGAGLYCTGTIEGLALTGCTFVVSDGPVTVPFYDLTAGNPVEIPYQPVFGYLQVPDFPAADGEAQALLSCTTRRSSGARSKA